ncbi:MAG: Uncharacterized protein K0S44_1882 [Bacteroidetes bacterium]|jgi:hypothetical protein|nr:Uncharacterized protein [Bacteroidota bacterium]
MGKYKFYLTHNTSTVEVFPLFDKISFRYEKDDVRFRKKLTTKLQFVNNPKLNIFDFTYLLGIENGLLKCEKIFLAIERSCDNGNSYSEYWNGVFAINTGEFDLNKCTYIVTPAVNDKYSCLYNNLNKEINLLLSGPLINVYNYGEFTNYEYWWCDVSAQLPQSPPGPVVGCWDTGTPDELTWTPLYSDIHVIPSPPGINTLVGNYIIYIRERLKTYNIGGTPNYPIGSGWEIVPGTNNGITTDFVRPYSATLPVVGTDFEIVPCGSSPSLPDPQNFVHLYFTNLAGYCATAGAYSAEFYYAPPVGLTKNYTQFRTLYDAFNYLVHQLCPDINLVVSDFFEWNPIGDAPGYTAGLNYVTGLDNKLARSIIAHKSDIIDPIASQHATRGMITFERLMANIKSIANVKWYIDDDLNFRIEHTSYFTYSIGYNVMTGLSLPFNRAKMQYTYKIEEMPPAEQFAFMESQNIDFVGADITYSSGCVATYEENKVKKYDAADISTDISFIENQPADIDYHGFFLGTYDLFAGVRFISKEIGKMTGMLLNNAHLSWANLHHHYHRHDRVLLNGNMNRTDQAFFSAIKTKEQKDVTLVLCCGEVLEPETQQIQTELGVGRIEEAEQVEEILKITIRM